MNAHPRPRRLAALACAVALAATGCAFHGVNSLPLPGAVGRGRGAVIYHVELANVGTLESNSPVTMADVVIGSVGTMKFKSWHADVEISVKPDVVVPANAVATIGQTSLLGSMHLAVNPPLGQRPSGRLQAGATIPLTKTSTYPSTEQTLSSLSVVINSGGLGHIGDIVHNFSTALSGNGDQLRELLTRLDTTVGVIDSQRDKMVDAITALNELSGTVAAQRDALSDAVRALPPALDVLIRERPRITTALDKLRQFSITTTGLIHDSQADLIKDLRNLEPTIKAIADVGPDLDTLLAYLPLFPFTQDVIDRGIRGDYINLFCVVDFTLARLKRTLLLGTRWGDPNAEFVPAPGEPFYLNHTYGSAPTPGAPQAPPGGLPNPRTPLLAPMSPQTEPFAPLDQPDTPRSGGH